MLFRSSRSSLSPAAVKEERERKPRILCDHSWNPVNEKTLPHAPPEAMMQFGGTLQRILRRICHADPKYGPVYLSKFDIKDGFYRLFLAANDCPRLSIILPLYPEEEQLVATPLACTMGWTQSPAPCPKPLPTSPTPGCVLNRLFLYQVTA